jgi:peptidoglycan hydrolase-like protein with peptidoglycan-binding domain
LLVVAAVLGAAVLSTSPADAGAAAFGRRALRPGMHGHDVRVLQRYLSRVGIATAADGQYGPRTTANVRSWERAAQRAVDGRVSRSDARALRRQVISGRGVTSAPSALAAPAAPAPERATLGADGHARAPVSAPAEVRAVVDAANRIVGKPYEYGGGHARWEDTGYDCSGSESYALRGGGFVRASLTSSDFESWGVRGKGTWITSYANGGHSFLVVAGLRFDTGWNNAGKGPRWSEQMRPVDGYVVRHPLGF